MTNENYPGAGAGAEDEPAHKAVAQPSGQAGVDGRWPSQGGVHEAQRRGAQRQQVGVELPQV